jgi:hypothetical protein
MRVRIWWYHNYLVACKHKAFSFTDLFTETDRQTDRLLRYHMECLHVYSRNTCQCLAGTTQHLLIKKLKWFRLEEDYLFFLLPSNCVKLDGKETKHFIPKIHYKHSSPPCTNKPWIKYLSVSYCGPNDSCWNCIILPIVLLLYCTWP